MSQCNNCGTDLTGLTYHSGERGLAYCCLCAHPGQPCPTDTGKPSNALPDVPGALNTQGRESPKKNRRKTSLATQSTKAEVGASGQAEALTPGKPPPEGESDKGVANQADCGGETMYTAKTYCPVCRKDTEQLVYLDAQGYSFTCQVCQDRRASEPPPKVLERKQTLTEPCPCKPDINEQNTERSIMAEEKKTRRRRKALLYWSITRWCAQDGYAVNLKERGYELTFPDGKTVICASFIEAKARAELYARQMQEIAELDLKFAEDVE